MKTAVLYRNENLYSTRHLVTAGKKRGHEPDVVNTIHYSIALLNVAQPCDIILKNYLIMMPLFLALAHRFSTIQQYVTKLRG
jgi:hypothetical protein